MPKIEYEDSSIGRGKTKKGYHFVNAIIFIVIGLLVGAIGGIGGILLLSADSGSIAKKLGISDFSSLSIPTTRTEKIIIEESSAIIDATSKVSSSVVSIQKKKTIEDIYGQLVEQQGSGTGFIITNDGLIITNKHVVKDSNSQYSVVLADGKSYDAQVQSLDPYEDIAVLKIDAKNLPVVELGDSDQLEIGQWVVAVGNALGEFDNTVTVGVISARNRKVEATDEDGSNSETIDNLIQTDAAINLGNSGGPLVNLAGQVIGINTAMASGAQNIGFAIPINQAKTAIDSIKKTGRIIRPYLGVRYVQITNDLAQRNNFPVNYGALVMKGNGLAQVAVVPGSPADKAGIKENDIILEINGEKIDQNNTLLKLIQQYKVGDKIEIKISSKGEERTVKIKLEEGKSN